MPFDPLTMTLLVSGGIFFCAFMIGRGSVLSSRDEIIESTIDYLAANGYVKTVVNENGEIELVKLQ